MSQFDTVPGYRLSWAARVVLVCGLLFLLSGFALAISLQPDPRGYGTHQRLGLPPCTFQTIFDMPCPSCGMTTSFSNFVRGRWIAAARANPAGLLLAIVCAMLALWIAASLWAGRTLYVRQPELAALWLMLAVCGATLLQWGVRWAWIGY